MFKSLTHGEKAINIFVSKGEDCGAMKKDIDVLKKIVNNHADVMNGYRVVATLATMGCVAAILCQHKWIIRLIKANDTNAKILDNVRDRVAKLEKASTTEETENQEN